MGQGIAACPIALMARHWPTNHHLSRPPGRAFTDHQRAVERL